MTNGEKYNEEFRVGFFNRLVELGQNSLATEFHLNPYVKEGEKILVSGKMVQQYHFRATYTAPNGFSDDLNADYTEANIAREFGEAQRIGGLFADHFIKHIPARFSLDKVTLVPEFKPRRLRKKTTR